jgi:hypothetical protein
MDRPRERSARVAGDIDDHRKFTVEQRLFHGLHHVKAPSVKEFKEAWEFCAAVRGTIGDEIRVVRSMAVGSKLRVDQQETRVAACRSSMWPEATGLSQRCS